MQGSNLRPLPCEGSTLADCDARGSTRSHNFSLQNLGLTRILGEWCACRRMDNGAPPVLPPKNQGKVGPPMAENLTRAKIEKFVAAGVPPGKLEAVLWDSAVTGLGLRMRLTGSVSWLFLYRPKGAGRSVPSRKATLGSWPSLSLDAARAAARIKAGEVASGADPALARRVEKTARRTFCRRSSKVSTLRSSAVIS